MPENNSIAGVLAKNDYEIVMCKNFAEVISGEMSEKYRSLRLDALSNLYRILNRYQKSMYHDKLLSGIAKKKGEMILNAKSKAEIERILHPKAPHFDGNQFIPDEYSVPEEELICWSETSLQAPLVPVACDRYRELFREIFPEESEALSI